MSELPTVGTPDSRWNSRPLVHLKTIATELENLRCRNSRYMSELPTVGTSDLRRNSRHSVHLKTVVGLWSSIPNTSGMNTGHVRYDQGSELFQVSYTRDIGTPNRCSNSRQSELPTNLRTTILPLLGKYQTRPARPAKIKLALLSLKYSKLTWVGLSTYETLSINMMHPS